MLLFRDGYDLVLDKPDSQKSVRRSPSRILSVDGHYESHHYGVIDLFNM